MDLTQIQITLFRALTWLIWTFALVPIVCVSVALYRLLLHPLAQVPGPKLAAVSNVWHARHVRNGSIFLLGKSLHEKYGPVVRVGPNEVWCNSKEAFKHIYGK
jgi:hypothetical protein